MKLTIRAFVFAVLSIFSFIASLYYIPYLRTVMASADRNIFNIFAVILEVGTTGVLASGTVIELFKKDENQDVFQQAPLKMEEVAEKLKQIEVEPVVKENSQTDFEKVFRDSLTLVLLQMFKQKALQFRIKADGKTDVSVGGLTFEITGTGKEIEVKEKQEDEEVFEVEDES